MSIPGRGLSAKFSRNWGARSTCAGDARVVSSPYEMCDARNELLPSNHNGQAFFDAHAPTGCKLSRLIGFRLVGCHYPVPTSDFVRKQTGARWRAFYGRMYAARSIPLEIFVGVPPIVSGSVGVAAVVLLASAVQMIDMAIALSGKDWKMLGGASAGSFLHLACGLAML